MLAGLPWAYFRFCWWRTFKAHGANGWLFTNKGGGWEFTAFFAIACIVQFLLGDGAYAIGSIFHRKRA